VRGLGLSQCRSPEGRPLTIGSATTPGAITSPPSWLWRHPAARTDPADSEFAGDYGGTDEHCASSVRSRLASATRSSRPVTRRISTGDATCAERLRPRGRARATIDRLARLLSAAPCALSPTGGRFWRNGAASRRETLWDERQCLAARSGCWWRRFRASFQPRYTPRPTQQSCLLLEEPAVLRNGLAGAVLTGPVRI
jgi:hypothetical protein